jgi:diguanylate cyclase (GGDEF)-like protein
MATTSRELTGRSAYEAFPWLAGELPGAVARALEGHHVQQLTVRADGTGQARHYEVRVVRSEADQVLVLVRDVSEVRVMQEQLQHRAFHDPLTGLANRSLFADRVDHALSSMVRAGASPTLLLVDLDGFKHVNDVHGHLVGDAVLSAVARRLSGTVRPQDTVARLGGDEFAVLVDDGGLEAGEQLARRLLDRVGRPVRAGDVVTSVSASIGVVCAQPDDDLVSLLRHGDTALYAAKAAGKNRTTTYDDAMRRRAQDRTTLESDLRTALDEDELRVHYQPIRDLGTGALYGWEALVRWAHPALGLLAPEVFLPLAEEMGLMPQVTGHVLRRAAADAGRLGGLMHVNLSPSQLVEPALVGLVDQVLRSHRLPGGRLVLELVESALTSDPDEASAAMQLLRELDVGLSLDDFGTGFSSLSRLHALPFTELKLDRSFLTSLGEQGRDAVAEAVLSLGGALGLTVVAEGIESQSQAERLRQLGCRFVPGFYLGRPSDVPGDLVSGA